MKRSRFTETQVVSILKEADAGMQVKEVCRKYGISEATYYSWKSKYGGMTLSDLKRMKELESELGRLKRFLLNFCLNSIGRLTLTDQPSRLLLPVERCTRIR